MSKQNARPGDLYTDDAYYLPIERELETKHNLPSGILGDIRKKGERSNRNQSPSTGARSVYQIIPGTRSLFLKAYGVDAYAGDRGAAEVAALHIKESLQRNKGDLSLAVREYHGGPDRAGWGSVNRDYVRRVMGSAPAATANPNVPGQRASRGTTVRTGPMSHDEVQATADALWSGDLTPAEAGSKKPLAPNPVTAADVAPKPNLILQGASGVVDGDFGRDFSQSAQIATEARDKEKQRQLDDNVLTKAVAAIDDNWITSMIGRSIDRKLGPADPSWASRWEQTSIEAGKYAQNAYELEILLDPSSLNSEADYLKNVADVDRRRRNQEILGSGGTGSAIAWNIGSSILDPAGFILGGAAGKIVQVGRAAKAGVTVSQAGRSGLLGTIAEATAANVGFTGIMDATGEPVRMEDYLLSGVAGAAIGTALHGVSRIAGRADASDMQAVADLNTAVGRDISALRSSAISELGEDATEGAIQNHMGKALNDRAERILRIQLGEVDDADRLLPEGIEASLNDLAPVNAPAQEGNAIRKLQQQRAEERGLDSITNPAEQYTALELDARSQAIVEAAGLTDAELDRNLIERWSAKFGIESDAVRLIRSKSPVLKAMAIQLLESTTGIGGRKPTAAVSKALLENRYMEHLMGYDRAFNDWATITGKGWTDVNLGNRARAEFDRAVWFEVEGRQSPNYIAHSDANIVRAADSLEQGFQVMGDHLRRSRVLGSANIPENARGYISHIMNVGKLVGMSRAQLRKVEKVYSDQLVGLNSYSYIDEAGERVTKSFDRKFSNTLAKRVLAEARGRARGNTYMPANLQTPEGGEIVRGAIKSMGLSPAEQEAALNSFRRGGQSYTKGRLKLDMSTDIGEGMKLGDLFQQDIQSLYRNYARKASGDVSLARYGILGRQTLEIMRTTGDLTGATADELHAFDRMVSEFTNVPWAGAKQSEAAKNISALTSSAQLGGMVFTQAAETSNAIAAIGVRATLASIPDLRRIWKSLGQWRKGGAPKDDTLGDLDEIFGYIGGEDFHSTRLFDAPDQNVEVFGQESLGWFSKFSRASSHMTMVASGFRTLHSVQVRGMAHQIVHKAIRYIHRGEASPALRDMGITDDMVAAIRTELRQGRITSVDAKGRITGPVDLIGSQLDSATIHAFAQAVERGAGQIIQRTFVGETSAWAHNDYLKLLLKFRTFGITSMEKQAGRQFKLGGGGAGGAIRIFGIYAGAMGFAIPIYLARLQAQSLGMSRAEREEFFEKRASVGAIASATSKYISVMGLAPDAADLVLAAGSGYDILPEGMIGGRGGAQGNVASLNPVLGMADNAYKATTGSPGKALRVLPGNNLPWVIPIFNGLSSEE